VSHGVDTSLHRHERSKPLIGEVKWYVKRAIREKSDLLWDGTLEATEVGFLLVGAAARNSLMNQTLFQWPASPQRYKN